MEFRAPSRCRRRSKSTFVNLMSQPGETTNFRASDHVAAILAPRRPDLETVVDRRLRGQFAAHTAGPRCATIRRTPRGPWRSTLKIWSAWECVSSVPICCAWRDVPRRKKSGTIRAPRRRRDRTRATGPSSQTQTHIMNTTVVILAAGLGTRMRSKHAKVLHRAGGLAAGGARGGGGARGRVSGPHCRRDRASGR